MVFDLKLNKLARIELIERLEGSEAINQVYPGEDG